MFGLRQLFYPWGFVVQAVALIHFARRRPEGYWLYVILFGGFVGATAYIVVEVLPDAGLLRGVFQGFGRRSRIQALEIQIIDNPSAGNYEELGELCLEQKQYAKAREAFDKAIAARGDSPHAFYNRAKCNLGLGELASAIPDLEHVVKIDSIDCVIFECSAYDNSFIRGVLWYRPWRSSTLRDVARRAIGCT